MFRCNCLVVYLWFFIVISCFCRKVKCFSFLFVVVIKVYEIDLLLFYLMYIIDYLVNKCKGDDRIIEN